MQNIKNRILQLKNAKTAILICQKILPIQYIPYFHQNRQYFTLLNTLHLGRQGGIDSVLFMSKQIEKLKKQLLEFSEVVNSFTSEAVQVRVIERLLDVMTESEKAESDSEDYSLRANKKSINQPTRRGKKPGATKILNQLLATDFFETPHSISSIADYCHENFQSDFKTSELSGILLKLAKENKLKRERSNENNRFEYVKVG